MLVALAAGWLALAPPVAAKKSADWVVGMVSFAFRPPTLTIAKGDTVTWINEDPAQRPHTSTSDAGVWDSGRLAVGQAFSFTFDRAGTYTYYCAVGIHRQLGMVGTITVVEKLKKEKKKEKG
jgi:plastocyanin